MSVICKKKTAKKQIEDYFIQITDYLYILVGIMLLFGYE